MQEHEAIMMYVRCGNYESDAESLFRYVAHNYGARHQVWLSLTRCYRAAIRACQTLPNSVLRPGDYL